MFAFGSQLIRRFTGQPRTSRPLYHKLDGEHDVFNLFCLLQGGYDYAYLLESVVGPAKLAEYSYIGFGPRLTLKVKDGKVKVLDEEGGEVQDLYTSEPLQLVKDLVGQPMEENYPRLLGGAVGYVAYDAVRYWERLPSRTSDELSLPDLEFALYDDGIVFDHRRGRAHYYTLGRDRFKELKNLASEGSKPGSLHHSTPRSNIDQATFVGMVKKAKEYIAAGDIFQVVLSRRIDVNLDGDPLALYAALHHINPSPYMYHLKMGEHLVLGSSPEMLVRVEGGSVETYPIAGTRPRGASRGEDERLGKDLLADPKERAEHVMLVDLARNDLGRVSRYGTVTVPEFMVIEEYSHVQHIVSRVVGALRGGCDAYDAVRSVFPAGTVSGAPKVRAMEIIEELEPDRRGPYAGAVGFFSYNGCADFAITIRSLVAEGPRGHIQAGAGIVADSVPEREWMETEHKARALMKALELAEEGR